MTGKCAHWLAVTEGDSNGECSSLQLLVGAVYAAIAGVFLRHER